MQKNRKLWTFYRRLPMFQFSIWKPVDMNILKILRFFTSALSNRYYQHVWKMQVKLEKTISKISQNCFHLSNFKKRGLTFDNCFKIFKCFCKTDKNVLGSSCVLLFEASINMFNLFNFYCRLYCNGTQICLQMCFDSHSRNGWLHYCTFVHPSLYENRKSRTLPEAADMHCYFYRHVDVFGGLSKQFQWHRPDSSSSLFSTLCKHFTYKLVPR